MATAKEIERALIRALEAQRQDVHCVRGQQGGEYVVYLYIHLNKDLEQYARFNASAVAEIMESELS